MKVFILPCDMEISKSRWGLLNANSSRGKNHLSPRICSAQHLWQQRSLDAPGEQQRRESLSLSGNGSSWPAVIIVPGFADGLRSDKLVVSILAYSTKLQKTTETSTPRNMAEICTAPRIAEWSLRYNILALEHMGANTGIAAPLFSEENVDWW